MSKVAPRTSTADNLKALQAAEKQAIAQLEAAAHKVEAQLEALEVQQPALKAQLEPLKTQVNHQIGRAHV